MHTSRAAETLLRGQSPEEEEETEGKVDNMAESGVRGHHMSELPVERRDMQERNCLPMKSKTGGL